MNPGAAVPGISFKILSVHRTRGAAKEYLEEVVYPVNSLDSVLIVPNRHVRMNFMHNDCSD
jgi:hypothetical protein